MVIVGLAVGGFRLVTYGSYDGCWAAFRAVMVLTGLPLGLQVGDLRVLGWLVGCLWGCRLATYGSYDSCWAFLGLLWWLLGRL